MSATGIVITRDLFFSSKITGTAVALGLAMKSIATLDRLREILAAENVNLVILDLDASDIASEDVLAALPEGAQIATVAFGPHVETDKLEAARRAGFGAVLPRSKFSAQLAEILRAANDA